MAVKDLVSGVLAESITTSTTNILVTIAQNIGASGIQAFFPTPPFYITIMPKSPIVGVANRLDSEIIQVTAVGHDQVGNAALTGVRGQRDTTAKAFSAGDIVTVGVYTDDAVLLGGTGTTETATPWIESGDITNNAVTSDKIDYTTLNTVYAFATQTAYTANSSMCQITIPTSGVYLISAFARGYASASVGNKLVNLYLTKNGTSLGNAHFNSYSDGTAQIANAINRADVFASGDVVALRVDMDLTLTTEVCNISAVRIK